MSPPWKRGCVALPDKGSGKVFWSHTSSRALGLFCQQLQMLLGAGIAPVDAFNTLAAERRGRQLGEDARRVANKIRQGNSLSDSAASSPKSFPPLVINMLKAAERGGGLDRVLEGLTDYYDHQADLKSRLIQALLYPVIVIVVAVAVGVFLLTTVFPAIIGTIVSLDGEVPAPTRMLLGMSEFVSSGWPVLLLLMIVLVGGILAARRHEGFRFWWDRWVLKVPVIRRLIYYMQGLRLAESLGILLGNGVDMLSSLDTVAEVLTNRLFKAELQGIKEKVRRGHALGKCFDESSLFKGALCQMVAVGERAGTLEESLYRAADYYTQESKRWMKNLSTVLEPALILCLGLMVMFFAVSLMAPIYQVYEGYLEFM
ncbi:type II secretion system F family protein [Eubacterium sp.]|uniref:type II secretion system F family protein n=1 Tax=Eubacterium sp. TaxID=142586 RepID=UPI002FC6524C